MPRPAAGRALFYTRDSEGRGECAPPQEVRWAIERARDLGLRFSGTPAEIELMMRDGRAESGDLFLDFGVSGNVMKRAGLDAVRRVIAADQTVSHLIIPRRDRLVRPENPIDGIQMECEFRRVGISIVIREKVLSPLARGQRMDFGDLIVGLVEYEDSGKFRRVLADKLLRAQVKLAEQGYSFGGSPPYGFARWLTRTDGKDSRQNKLSIWRC